MQTRIYKYVATPTMITILALSIVGDDRRLSECIRAEEVQKVHLSASILRTVVDGPVGALAVEPDSSTCQNSSRKMPLEGHTV